MELKERIDELLLEMPSFYFSNEAAADKLFSVAVELGIKVSRGCKDCIGRCYAAIMRTKRNNYNMHIGEQYLFNARVHSYRLPNTGKALTNSNSTVEERKAVYDSSEGRRTLFDPASIPVGDIKVIPAPKVEVVSEAKHITKKRVSTKKRNTSSN